MNEKSLTVYLHELLSLELAEKEIDERISEIENRIVKTKESTLPVPPVPDEPKEPEMKTDYFYNGRCADLSQSFGLCVRLAALGAGAAAIIYILVLLKKGGSVFMVPLLMLAAGALVLAVWFFIIYAPALLGALKEKRNYARRYKEYVRNDLARYENKTLAEYEADSAFFEEQKVEKIIKLRDKISDVEKQREKLIEVRKKAYDAGLIPEKKQDACCLYFMFAYMTSQGKDFESAVKACKPASAKENLSDAIKEKRKEIMRNAVVIAKKERKRSGGEEREELVYNEINVDKVNDEMIDYILSWPFGE